LTNLYTITRLVATSGGESSGAGEIARIFIDMMFTYIGFMAFKNVTPSPTILIGLTLSFSGAIYSYFKWIEWRPEYERN